MSDCNPYGPPILAHAPRPAEDDHPFTLWCAHVDAGRIGANPPPAPGTVARRIAFSESLLGRRLRRHEGGAA